jgi:hypothetical protein
MPKYEFFVSNGAPAPATKEVRSHAMRNALQLKAKSTPGTATTVGQSDSRHTVEKKADLKHRFRLVPGKTKAKKVTAAAITADGDEAVLAARGVAGTVPTISKSAQSKRLDRLHSQLGKLDMAVAPVSSALDPFDILPVRRTKDGDLLMQYCRSFFFFLPKPSVG